MSGEAEQDAVFQRLMDLGRGFQPDLYDVAGEVVVMLREAVAAPVCTNCEGEYFACTACGVRVEQS